MAKQVPEVLRAHILPFHWDVKKLWELEADINRVERSWFDYLLELPLWSSVAGKGMLFDIEPITVIRNPALSPYQAGRLAKTDTAYPIDFLMYEKRPWILDGVHRLAKLYMLQQDVIQIRLHDAACITRIRIS